MTPFTTFVRVTPEDLCPGFDENTPPDPGLYWNPVALEVTEEWNALMNRWEQARWYQRYHSRQYVPLPKAYEMPSLAKLWADEVIKGEQPMNLVLYGAVGTGKTHGACATACYLAALWQHAQFTDAPSLLFQTASMLLGGLKNFGSGDRDTLLRHTLHTPVLVLDDLTRFEITNFDVESLGQILDTRAHQGLPTILTLNHGMIEQALQGLPDFLASRVEAGRLTAVLGPDRRREDVA
jgi:chromosomal replication initiation ATPase DnaA